MLVLLLAACDDNKIKSPTYGDRGTNAKIDADLSGISFQDQIVSYDGMYHEMTIDGVLPLDISVSYSENAFVNAGVYEVTAFFNYDKTKYNPIPNMTATLTILEIPVEGLVFNSQTFTHDGTEKSLKVEFTKGNEGLKVEYENNYQTGAGVYEVRAKIIDVENNYCDIDDLVATLTINKAKYDMSQVKFEDKTYPYNPDINRVIKIECKLPTGVEVSYKNNILTDVGKYEVIVSFSGNPNYEDIPDMVCHVEIYEVDLKDVLLFKDITYVYDGGYKTLAIDFNGLDKLLFDVTYTPNTFIMPGVYEVEAVVKSKDKNYHDANFKATLTIEKMTYDTSNLFFPNQEYVYDGNPHVLNSIYGLPMVVEASFSLNVLTMPGTLEVTVTFISDTIYYKEIPPMITTLTVKPAKLTGVIFNDQTFVYDGYQKSIAIEGIIIPNGIEVTYTNNYQVEVGNYVVTAYLVDKLGRYEPLELSANLTILPA